MTDQPHPAAPPAAGPGARLAAGGLVLAFGLALLIPLVWLTILVGGKDWSLTLAVLIVWPILSLLAAILVTLSRR